MCVSLVGTIRFENSCQKGGKGGVGGHIQDMPCTWLLPWLIVEQPWSALAGPFLTLLAQMVTEITPFPL